MKRVIFIAASLLAQSLAATVAVSRAETLDAPPAQVLELKGYLSVWTQDCAGAACQLPKPGERNRQVTLLLAMPAAPGEASAAHASEKLTLPGGGELSADMDFYAVCPYGGKDNCAGRYFQAQVFLSGPAGAFCAAALNSADFAPFPVLMCAGTLPGGRRFGLTLHRQLL